MTGQEMLDTGGIRGESMALKELLKKKIPYVLLRKFQNAREQWQVRHMDMLANVNKTNYDKHCLLAYITTPFTRIAETHQNQWQVTELARIIGEMGYNVDVIDFRSVKEKAPRKYDLLVDIQPLAGRPRLKWLKADAKKIVYLTGSESRWANAEEEKRRERVKATRHVTIPPEREAAPLDKAVESFDASFMIGNAYNWQTYQRAPEKMPPVYYIPNGGSVPVHPGGDRRSLHKFLFFASSGQVHKGLDLLLEVFANYCTDCELFVCSSYLKEKVFCKAYEQELFHTPNIHPIGFVDIQGQQFAEITAACGYVIIPSCSEGQIGSVLYPMARGCVPILSRACGYDEDEAIHLPDCNLDTIARYVKKYAEKDADWLAEKSLRCHEIVAQRYSREAFRKAVQEALLQVLH